MSEAKAHCAMPTDLQRLVVIAVAVAFWRGDVAILGLIVLDPRRRRFLRLIVDGFWRLGLFLDSAHSLSLDSGR